MHAKLVMCCVATSPVVFIDCVIHHERDVREEQKYISVARASNNKRNCNARSLLLLSALRTCRSGFPIAIVVDLSSDHF